MSIEDLRDLLRREPFEPFRIQLTSGTHYDIRDPFLVAMMKSRLFIAHNDRSVYVPYLHIAALETLGNGHNGHRRRKGKR